MFTFKSDRHRLLNYIKCYRLIAYTYQWKYHPLRGIVMKVERKYGSGIDGLLKGLYEVAIRQMNS